MKCSVSTELTKKTGQALACPLFSEIISEAAPCSKGGRDRADIRRRRSLCADLAGLLAARLLIVTAGARWGQLLESWERIAAARDRGAMIGRGRGHDFANLKTGLAQRMLQQLVPRSHCHLCVVWGHLFIANVLLTFPGRSTDPRTVALKIAELRLMTPVGAVRLHAVASSSGQSVVVGAVLGGHGRLGAATSSGRGHQFVYPKSAAKGERDPEHLLDAALMDQPWNIRANHGSGEP